VSEIEEILASCGVVLEPRPATVPDVEENAGTLEGNARLKAEAIANATGAGSLADDTGLEVEALAGARTPQDRRARFRTVVMVRWPDGSETVAEGIVSGVIASEVRGDGGFGYDPVFVPDDGDGRTFAEMNSSEKHAISHRGRALRALAQELS
jgi:XTP/dITP diphosphohydrolase